MKAFLRQTQKMEKQKKPDFIGIGAQRSGTSWLYNCLIEHPDVYMPRKEVHFFDDKYDRGVEWYFSLFGACTDGQLCGEITPDYMFDKGALEKLSASCGTSKLIIILREPLSRAYSAFSLFRSHGQFNDWSFQEAIDKEPFILSQSLYAEQLETVYALFDKKQVFVGLYDDIKHAPNDFYRDVCQFLEIDTEFSPVSLKQIKNSSAFSSSQTSFNLPKIQQIIERSFFSGLFKWLKSTSLFGHFKSWLISIDTKKSETITISENVLEKVLEDIDKLECKINKDLGSWKKSIKQKYQ